ncbi:MAG: YidC/Oxa1 family membrane protein insertase [Actinobacteria bacterium]|nr:YidC/Oxa1 family membrane protein insertase [Actinomycetota bacterium]MCI0543929.1 YidC/Oxa1 family membrane protein insertase [Actinomycetota bacterium]
MGQVFDALKVFLGSVLSFFFDLIAPPLSHGVGLGLSIIMLTIAINLLVFPLTLKQTRATRAFTEIQPKIRKIQTELKDDPQEMQRRLLEVQREAGATPGGCLLPLLIQMPIWLALFQLLNRPLDYIPTTSALAVAVADTGATFLGMHLTESPAAAWGLTGSNGILYASPYLLLIAFMVATQYIQQWHATYGQTRPDQRGAQAQQAVTRILPLFIGLVSWNFPAGLVLYWTTSNLFRLGQQMVIFRIDGRPTPVKTEVEEPTRVEGDGPKKPQQGAADKRRRRRRS